MRRRAVNGPMELLKRFLGGGAAGSRSGVASAPLDESDSATRRASPENAPRRELVQVVLRDTMRKHGIPSDWIDCRILSVVTLERQAGMHVQFIVRHGESRLLPFVHAFQDTFWQELEKFESNPHKWLFSVAWQFDGPGDGPGVPGLEDAAEGWEEDTQPPTDDTQPPEQDPEELTSDLHALYAIRDAAMSEPAPLSDVRQAKPPGGT